MKIKALALLPGVIALSLAFAPVFPSLAQAPSSESSRSWQKRGKMGAQLNLTDAQKAQMKQIREASRQKMDAVLTPAQKEQLQVAKQNKQKPNLNLSDEQKASIKAIRQESKRQMEAILTPEQIQKLQASRQQWMQNRNR
ncbi:MAG: Spy/CpxP family protein refolding chaperone [Leptolyngbyaceae bacterium]|nr:Spy/CpxP family protein refolding chaperone [Leptolyngbyaceae bacterium]